MDIKVEVKFSEGYERRFTEACLDVLRKRKANEDAQRRSEEIKK